MTKIDFLDAFTEFTKEAVKDVILPCALQSGREVQQYRAPAVHRMRLPDMSSMAKKVPYIINQIVTSDDVQKTGKKTESSVVLRTIFCVYSEDDEEGSLALVELTERLRIAVLKNRIIAKQYELEMNDNALEVMFYPDDTAPYFAAEMISYWKVPAVEREDALRIISGNLPHGA